MVHFVILGTCLHLHVSVFKLSCMYLLNVCFKDYQVKYTIQVYLLSAVKTVYMLNKGKELGIPRNLTLAFTEMLFEIWIYEPILRNIFEISFDNDLLSSLFFEEICSIVN